MENEIKLIGTDFLIDINNFKYDLDAQCYSAEVKSYIQLPVSELKNIGNFLEKVVEDDCEELADKNFRIIINGIDEKSLNLEIEGSEFALSIENYLLDTEFNLGIQIWDSRLTNKKLREISEIQDRTWISMNKSDSGEEINKVWDRKWEIIINEISNLSPRSPFCMENGYITIQHDKMNI